ncbi:MAG: ATP-binding protein [Chitinophagales bacterium]
MEPTTLVPLSGFFDNYSEAVIITNSSEKTIYFNKAFGRLTGFGEGDLPKLTVEELFKVRVNYKLVETHKLTRWESGITKSDGLQIWMRVSRSPIQLADGSQGSVYTLIDNPTMDQLAGLLKESESRFATLADASPVMIWMTDKDNLCYYFNKAWLDFTGKKFEEELGTGWLKNVHPDDMILLNDIAPQLNAYAEYSVEYRLRRKDGTYRHILEIGTPRFLPDSKFAGYMGSCLDISEMKLVQNELSNYANELKRSNEELEQFAYVASHDMQEPLRMIASYIQLIQRGLESGRTDGLTEFMGFVLDGTSRMQALISDLLQFSRVSRKGNPFTRVDMNETARIAIGHLQQKIKENNATVNFGSMPVVFGDSFQLIRLLQNLADNAIKFKHPDRKPEINISVEERDSDWLFKVSDNGIGIEDKFYNRIFVIFQRLHTRNEYEGTGIGLAVCKKIVERHGGEIWVESEEGKGSTFYFTIKKQQ